MRRAWLLCGLLLSAPDLCGEDGFQAVVSDGTLTSRGFPRGEITFDPGIVHLGSDRFVLYGQTDCEIHLFGETRGPDVKRLYWLQLEGYKAHNDFRYDYSDSPRSTTIAGRTFHDDVWFMAVERARERWPAGSDAERVLQILEARGFQLAPELMGIRLVLLDEAHRRELMLIYYEGLEANGLSVAALEPGGSASAAWSRVSGDLRRRALAGMQVSLE